MYILYRYCLHCKLTYFAPRFARVAGRRSPVNVVELERPPVWGVQQLMISIKYEPRFEGGYMFKLGSSTTKPLPRSHLESASTQRERGLYQGRGFERQSKMISDHSFKFVFIAPHRDL